MHETNKHKQLAIRNVSICISMCVSIIFFTAVTWESGLLKGSRRARYRICTNLVCIQMTPELRRVDVSTNMLVMIAIGEKALIRSGIYTSRLESQHSSHYTSTRTTYFPPSQAKGCERDSAGRGFVSQDLWSEMVCGIRDLSKPATYTNGGRVILEATTSVSQLCETPFSSFHTLFYA